MTRRKGLFRCLAVGAAGTILAFAALGLIVVYTGLYNVAATAGHGPVARWLLATTMRSSVASRAEEIAAPARFTPAEIAAGAAEYKAMCQQCHGAPGAERADWAKGIVPAPPELGRAAKEWQPSEIFWIVKNGIKMSAMPAFGGDHDDATLWNIAAFVKALPTVTAERYAEIPAGHGDRSEASGEDHSGHTH
jgi:mono/diheme cytochrome c family protein